MSQKERIDAMEKAIADLQGIPATVSGMATAMDDMTKQLQEVMGQFRTLSNSAAAPFPPTGAPATGIAPNPNTTDSAGSESSAPPPAKTQDIPVTQPLAPVTVPGRFVPQLELPPFDGSDPIAWLAQAEQFFLVNNTPITDRVQLSLIAMSGRAMFWAQWVLRRSSSITWVQFSQELIDRFGDSSAINAYEAMHITRQTGSLEDYLALFEERVAQLPTLPSEQYLGMFLGGLQPSIRDRISESELSTVFSAIRAARRIDRSPRQPGQFQRSPFTSGQFSRSSAPYRVGVQSGRSGPAPNLPVLPVSKSGPSQSTQDSAGFRFNRNARHLTAEEAREFFGKGKCYRCSQPYGPLHKCAAKYLTIIEADGDEFCEDHIDPSSVMAESIESGNPEPSIGLQALQLSKLSFYGLDGATTMKLFGRVGDRRLLTMIDSGASHCFLAKDVAVKLNLPIDKSAGFRVILGDGSILQTTGICKSVPFTLDNHTFSIDCYIFPLSGIDIILGVTWLAKLGDVTANWAKLTMEFTVNGSTMKIWGDHSLTRKACSLTELSEIELGTQTWLLWAIEGNTELGHSTPLGDLSESQKFNLDAIISAYAPVARPPDGLPPHRAYDHHINLKPGYLLSQSVPIATIIFRKMRRKSWCLKCLQLE